MNNQQAIRHDRICQFCYHGYLNTSDKYTNCDLLDEIDLRILVPCKEFHIEKKWLWLLNKHVEWERIEAALRPQPEAGHGD